MSNQMSNVKMSGIAIQICPLAMSDMILSMILDSAYVG